ncbi:MAG: GTP 3',8-cyclase MoaA [Cyanobacteria bacterium MAG CAR4_bin_6]|nr:GTP 3',8-cyclase MoaA [Cyanobacteria bacterium MAG CAR4_bin_6]
MASLREGIPRLHGGEEINTGALDQRGRTLGVLRLSLTARCNLACRYCRPENRDPPTLLTHQQRLKLIGAASRLGCRRLRLTGGEPLLAPGLAPLVQAVKALDLVEDVAVTSNGVLLDRSVAQGLQQAGLDRITISLDGADPQAVLRMGGGHSFAPVLSAIGHAQAVGLPVKINMVAMAHGNGDQVIPMARLCRRLGVELRLIEYMDVGNRNGWRPEQVITAAAMTAEIGRHWPLAPVGRQHGSTARRWRYQDGGGFVSTIASISEPFCGDCNRLRVTADGMAYTCLFASRGTDLKPALDPRQPDAVLMHQLRSLWRRRQDRYSEERALQAQQTSPAPRPIPAEMAYMGG